MAFARWPWKSLLLLLFPVVIICFLSLQHTFNAQESFFYDYWLKLRPAQQISSDIAIIEIDDNTLTTLGQWPLPRDFHATLIDVLTELGVNAIVFDIIFSEPTDHDSTFAASIKANGHVYMPEVYDLSLAAKPSHVIEHPVGVLAPITPILRGGLAGTGHINVTIDPDGKTRHVPLFIKQHNGFVPQIGFQAACDYLKLNCGSPKFFHDRVVVNEQLTIPATPANELLVNYPGGWANSFKRFSYLGILAKYQQYKTGQIPLQELADLKGKVCFIGLTAAGTVDLKPSPIENNYPMTGVMASIFNSVVQGKFLSRLAGEAQVIYLVLLYMIGLFVCLKFKPWVSFLSMCGLGLLCCGVAGAMLIFCRVWIDVFLPLVMILCVYLVCASLRWTQERRKLEILEKEMAIAQKIQQQFLQGPQQEQYEVDMALWFQPAKYVAGDFYDVFKVDAHKVGVFIGDVSGKGLPAALCMAQAVSLFRIFSRQQASVAETLNRLNGELCFRNVDRFATALYALINTQDNTLAVASAGHGPAFLYRQGTQTLEELSLGTSVPLGVMPDSMYNTVVISMEPNDKLILFSDGINEARAPRGEEIGMERIKAHVLAHGHKPNNEMLESLKVMLMDFVGASPQHDDMTAIIISMKS